MLVAVSILGNPAALDVMRAFCDKHGLYFMEDNCESMDAEIGGKKAGTFGDLNTYSTFFSHHISTMEGGMVLTDDEELFHLLRALRNHGWTRDVPKPSPIFEKKDTDFYEAYRFILPGYNVRPIEMMYTGNSRASRVRTCTGEVWVRKSCRDPSGAMWKVSDSLRAG